jgi:hypothetical protein
MADTDSTPPPDAAIAAVTISAAAPGFALTAAARSAIAASFSAGVFAALTAVLTELAVGVDVGV